MTNEEKIETKSPLLNEGTAMPTNSNIIGFAEPLIGRTAKHDVLGYFGFPLIRAGQTVTPAIFDKAMVLGRLFELIASTDVTA